MKGDFPPSPQKQKKEKKKATCGKETTYNGENLKKQPYL